MMCLTKLGILRPMKDRYARTIAGLDVGVTICEDAWQHCGATPNDYDSDPIAQIVEWGRQGVVLHATVNLSASPYHSDKSEQGSP